MSEYCAAFMNPNIPKGPFYSFARAIERIEDPKELMINYLDGKDEVCLSSEPEVNQHGLGYRLNGLAVYVGILSIPDWFCSHLIVGCESRKTLYQAVEDISQSLGLEEIYDPHVDALVLSGIEEKDGEIVSGELH